jgi:ABC-type glycerol-3-phosphate transport system substrate-binding protein
MTLRRSMGLCVLLAVMGLASARVWIQHMTHEAPGVDTIRICHWQLESGFREALDELIHEYEAGVLARTGKRVQVVQVPISERGYSQYVNTGLIGGMAPDIIEQGKAKTSEKQEYIIRFYLPLGRYVREPNPYNAGTTLESTAWQDTFVDGLSGSYDRGLRDYYRIPFSLFTVRIFYNRDLLERATGRKEPPATYGELLDVCREVRAFAQREKLPLVPIAASKTQLKPFQYGYENTFLFPLIPRVDADLTGSVDPFEAYQAYVRGLWSFRSPEFQSGWRCMTEIAANFQEGWMAAQRDDSVFMFAQQRAVMLSSGSWDAQSIIRQAGDRFRVGIFDFPVPTDHPEYSEFVKGPATEADIRGGIPWVINLKTRHPDLCIDFLRFCTTPANNERFNRRITWIPVVRGAVLPPELAAFKPRIRGFYGTFSYSISSAVRLIGDGDRWLLYAGDLSPEAYADRLAEVYERTAAQGYRDELRRQQAHHRNLQRALAALQGAACFAAADDPLARAKRLEILSSVQGQALYGAAAAGRFPGRDGDGKRVR